MRQTSAPSPDHLRYLSLCSISTHVNNSRQLPPRLIIWLARLGARPVVVDVKLRTDEVRAHLANKSLSTSRQIGGIARDEVIWGGMPPSLPTSKQKAVLLVVSLHVKVVSGIHASVHSLLIARDSAANDAVLRRRTKDGFFQVVLHVGKRGAGRHLDWSLWREKGVGDVGE